MEAAIEFISFYDYIVALVRKKDIDEDIAAYAVCSVSFALGITENAPEPGEDTPWPDAGGGMDGCPLDDGPAETERLLSQTRVEAAGYTCPIPADAVPVVPD